MLRRPQLDYKKLEPVDTDRPELDPLVLEQVEVELKYEGYIRRQQSAIEEMRRLENKLLPEQTDYSKITGLRKEAQEKLSKIRPRSIGQASRISGVSPSDISVLIVWLGSRKDDGAGTAEKAVTAMAGTIDKGFLREQAALHGITLDDAALERFDLVARMMLDWNTKINLTTITQPREVVLKHFIDSMVAAPLLPEEASLIDVGTGAGYPGYPCHCAARHAKTTLLDSLNKRLVYLKELCSALELPAGLVHARAEDAGQDKEHREGYDVAAARAVAPFRCCANTACRLSAGAGSLSP